LWLIVGDRVVAECRADAGPALVRDYLERMARAGCRGVDFHSSIALPLSVTPAQAGVQNAKHLAPRNWTPACAGVTVEGGGAVATEAHLVSAPLPLGPITPGIHLAAPAFGALTSAQLRELLATPGLTALRPAAGRRLVVWGPQGTGCFPPFLATDDADPRLAVTACPGAPACGSALRPTRGLATALAAGNYGVLHLSGCGKGCGAPGDGTAQAIATADGWDLQGDDVSRLAAGLAAMGERRNDAL
jgi:precorrin-3B synthase